jgi:hypothetical protein
MLKSVHASRVKERAREPCFHGDVHVAINFPCWWLTNAGLGMDIWRLVMHAEPYGVSKSRKCCFKDDVSVELNLLIMGRMNWGAYFNSTMPMCLSNSQDDSMLMMWCVCRTHKILDLGYEPFTSASKIRIFFCQSFQNLLLGSIKLARWCKRRYGEQKLAQFRTHDLTKGISYVSTQ